MSGSLGRRPAADDRDATHPMRAPDRVTFSRRRWVTGPLLDQDVPVPTGTCVGHGWRNFLSAMPGPVPPWRGPSPFAIYDGALPLDEWPQNDSDPAREFGTSVRAGAKYLKSVGALSEYRWAWDEPTAVNFLLSRGPVVVGVNWYSSMDDPDAEGITRVSGWVRGGHCFLLSGVDTARDLAEGYQSWGQWGLRGSGRFFIPLGPAGLGRLIAEDGEACEAVDA